MPKSIQTPRLILKPLTQDDFPFLRSLHQSSEVMKYIGSGKPRSEEESKKALKASLQIAQDNPLLGSWIAYFNDEPVGNLILRNPATLTPTRGYEIGYSFIETYWGKGFATEAAKGIMDYTYEVLGAVRLVALINPENEASRRTLIKLGFVPCGFTEYKDPSTGLIKPTEILEIPTPLSD